MELPESIFAESKASIEDFKAARASKFKATFLGLLGSKALLACFNCLFFDLQRCALESAPGGAREDRLLSCSSTFVLGLVQAVAASAAPLCAYALLKCRPNLPRT